MNAPDRYWTCEYLFEPFDWPEPATVWVRTDLFEPKRREPSQDKVFAAMAVCVRHRFLPQTNHRSLYHRYVGKIASDRMEYSTWLMSVSDVLSDLDWHHLARGEGPRWPLANVHLIESLPDDVPSGVGEG